MDDPLILPTVSATRNNRLSELSRELADLMTSIGQGAGKAVDWLAGGAQVGAEPTLALMRGDAINEPFLPTADSGGRLGAIASAVSPALLIGALGTMGDAGSAAMESKSASLYNPPLKPQRPFHADYPELPAGIQPGDRLAFDIEGRPLVADHIAGRKRVGEIVGGDQEALTPEELYAVATRATGAGPQAVAPRQIGGDAGRLTRSVNPETGAPDWRIDINKSLNEGQFGKVLGHEVGHAIDEIAGHIPSAGLNAELRRVYNTLNTGQERTRNLTGPQHVGYTGDDVPRELMVEAIRAYMADPNYLKTVAPKTAAAIRAAVNEHPDLKHIIQFNAETGLPPAPPPQDDPATAAARASLIQQHLARGGM